MSAPTPQITDEMVEAAANAALHTIYDLSADEGLPETDAHWTISSVPPSEWREAARNALVAGLAASRQTPAPSREPERNALTRLADEVVREGSEIFADCVITKGHATSVRADILDWRDREYPASSSPADRAATTEQG